MNVSAPGSFFHPGGREQRPLPGRLQVRNPAAAVSAAGGKIYRALSPIGVVSAGAGFRDAIAKSSSVLAVGQDRFHALPDTPAAEVSGTEAGPTTADSLYTVYGWDMHRVNAPAVWVALPLPVRATATVAVLDVGVMDTHPDLAGQAISSKSTAYCSTSGGANNTAGCPVYSTLIDFDAHPEWSPADGCTAVPTTSEWHGTHVAGTIAAKFGGGRVVGVDPDARIAAYKVFDRYRYADDKGSAIPWAPSTARSSTPSWTRRPTTSRWSA